MWNNPNDSPVVMTPYCWKKWMEITPAAMKTIPGGVFKSVERIERGDGVTYHVKLLRGGASYKVSLSPEGEVLRRVREAKAEIEIPLP